MASRAVVTGAAGFLPATSACRRSPCGIHRVRAPPAAGHCIHRLIGAAVTGEAFNWFGDGSQRREFTYVDDVVEANLLAVEVDVEPGFVLPVGATWSHRCPAPEL